MEKRKLNIVITPMQEELDELLNKIEEKKEDNIGDIKGYSFIFDGEEFFVFISKIGKVNIGFDLGYISSLVKIKKVYVVGVAGSLKEGIQPLSVVVANKVAYYDVDIIPEVGDSPYAFGQMAGEELYFIPDEADLKLIPKLNTTVSIYVGTIIAGDSFATSKNMSKELLEKFDDPLAVDMEDSAVGHACRRLGVPFTIVRGISDTVFGSNNGEEYNEYLHLSARRAASVFLHIVCKEFAE